MQSTAAHDEWATGRGEHQLQPDISACRDDLFPGADPNFEDDDLEYRGMIKAVDDFDELRMSSARRIACVLAMHGIPGYESVRKYLETHRPGDVARWRMQNHEEPPAADSDMYGRALHILATIADPYIIPQDAVTCACDIGSGWKDVIGDTVRVYATSSWNEYTDYPSKKRYHDAVERCCEKLMQELLDRRNRHTMPERSIWGYYELTEMCWAHRTEVIKAYLAAADASLQLIEHEESRGTVPWGRPYDVRYKATHHHSDEVALFINGWVQMFHAGVPPNDQYGG